MANFLEGKTPSEVAKSAFDGAREIAINAMALYDVLLSTPGIAGNVGAMRQANAEREIAYALVAMSNGLEHLSVGIRATYLKLEQIERKLGTLAR